jgi:hypothetical protein
LEAWSSASLRRLRRDSSSTWSCAFPSLSAIFKPSIKFKRELKIFYLELRQLIQTYNVCSKITAKIRNVSGQWKSKRFWNKSATLPRVNKFVKIRGGLFEFCIRNRKSWQFIWSRSIWVTLYSNYSHLSCQLPEPDSLLSNVILPYHPLPCQRANSTVSWTN